MIVAPFQDGTPAFHDAWLVANPGVPHVPTVGIYPVSFVDQPECFDYIFVTEGLVDHLKLFGTDSSTDASDHQPVWIELK